MKLPKEVTNQVFVPSPADDFGGFAIIEAIVRDCAKVCNQTGEGYAGEMYANMILARYDLTESPTSDLVTERVGMLKP